MARFLHKIVQVTGILLVAIAIAKANEIEQLLNEFEIIPDVIDAAPNQFLKVTYKEGLFVNKGSELTPTQVKWQPEVAWEAQPDSYYTLILTDPDAPSRKQPTSREINHWLVVNVPGNDLTKGDEIRAYVGAGAREGTGLHRYIFLLYKQPGKLEFNETRSTNRSTAGREKFNTNAFTRRYGLGAPIAVNFFLAQYDDYVPILRKQLSEN